jgi:hypothetical protein
VAGTFTTKLLADGQLPLAEANLYVVPAATTTIVVTISLVNTDTVARVVNLYVRRAAGSSRRVGVPKNYTVGIGAVIETDREYTLGPGDAVRGDASAATVVDFSIHGVEET